MRNIKISGYGIYLPNNKIKVSDGIRYRAQDETQLFMAVSSAKEALKNASMDIEDIDCIVSASAVGIQPIPCTAALIHEQIAKGLNIPSLDINTTCTSFVTSLDLMSYLIHDGRYKNVLIVASDIASHGLNPNQKESFELFSDGACSIIISKTDDKNQGIIGSMQRTWSEGVHATEIRGGLTGFDASHYNEDTKYEYHFDMDGFSVLKLCAKKLPEMFEEFKKEYNISIDDIDLVIPHQASKALPMIMKRLKVPKEKYVDIVSDYGNLVSVSIPFTLCKMLEDKKIKKGDKVLLCGTAAGLTSNILLIEI